MVFLIIGMGMQLILVVGLWSLVLLRVLLLACKPFSNLLISRFHFSFFPNILKNYYVNLVIRFCCAEGALVRIYQELCLQALGT